jgi:ribosomal protein S18 acetylase RimI-like enzyme
VTSGVIKSCAFRTAAHQSDIERVREIVASTGFFSDAEIDVAVELIEDCVQKGAGGSDYRFVFADQHDATVGYACYGPIACTVGSFDLYWIVVHNDHRGHGLGVQLMRECERMIAAEGGRRIYVETSSRPQYEPTRKFYEKCGYRVEAVLEDFYAPGDGKVILVKTVNQ